MAFLKQLIDLATLLDQSGLHKQASQVDEIIKESAKKLKLTERFWRKVKKEPGEDGCWLWQGARDSHGYGILTIRGRNYMAHKISWETANNAKVPRDYVLLHTCDVPLCLNPRHLTPGTQQSNVDDRVKKDRSAKGRRNGRARLTDKDIRKIRKLRGKGWTELAIALLFRVGRSTISNVLKGKTWSWLND